MAPTSRSEPLRRPPLFWLLLPFACGYGGGYFLRNINAVAGPLLAQEFGLDAGGLGLLTSAYFLVFALAQIPLGIALDRYGPARVNALMLVTAALGATVFACADSIAALTIGRCLIGLGASAALMSAMSAVHLWAGPARAATCIGLILMVGGVGAILAGTPTQWAIDRLGWRAVFLAVAAFSCLTACLTVAIARHSRPVAAGQSLRRLIGGVAAVHRDGHFWRMCVPMMAIIGTMMAFQSLWAGTWMRDVAGYTDRIAIGNVLVAFTLGMTAAFGLAGWIADRLDARGIARLVIFKAYMLVALGAQMWIMAAPTLLPHLAWALLGFGANALFIGYSLLASRFPPEMTGRLNTSVNLLSFAAAFVLQWGIGAVVNLWPATATGYARTGYFVAWSILLLLQLAGFAWLVSGTRDGVPGRRPSRA